MLLRLITSKGRNRPPAPDSTSDRTTIYLPMASRAHALMQGRGYVTPQDVKSIGMDVLRHRVIITYEAEAEEKTSENVVGAIFDNIAVP